MEKKKSITSIEELENAINSIKEDKVLKSVCINVCNTARKIANYIDNFECIMTYYEEYYEEDTVCIKINNKYFTDIEQFYIGCFKSDVIYVCNNMNKPKFELIDIELFDDVTILKVLK